MRHMMSIRDLPTGADEATDPEVDQPSEVHNGQTKQAPPSVGGNKAAKLPSFVRGHILKLRPNYQLIKASYCSDIKRDEVAVHICAFLNCGAGGKIVIGVNVENRIIEGISMDRRMKDLFRRGREIMHQTDR
jgi:hypothetical protein